MAQAQGQNQINTLQQLLQLTQTPDLSMHHLKAQQPERHYILLGDTWMNQACEIIHYREIDHVVLGFIDIRIGILQKEPYCGTQLQTDITNGLEMINNASMPDIATAWSRWLEIEGEERYYTSACNSEKVMAYIMTGAPYSILSDDIKDVLKSELNKILFKGIVSFMAVYFLKDHTEKIVTEINTKPKTMSKFQQFISKMFGASPNNIRMQRLYILAKAGGCSFLFSVILEISSFLSIFKLWFKKKRNTITNQAFKRKFVKITTAMLCAMFGTNLGCMLGFWFSTYLWVLLKSPYLLGFTLNIIVRGLGIILLTPP